MYLLLVQISFQKFQTFGSNLDISQAISSSYHHPNNGQVESFIKFIQRKIKMYRNKNWSNIVLIQVSQTTTGTGIFKSSKNTLE